MQTQSWQRPKKQSKKYYEVDNPDLLIERAFREKCIFTDYIIKVWII